MAKVFLDPGHGGKDSGALGNNMLEKVINLEVSLQVRDILKQHGVDVKMSRETDVYIDLQPRCDMASAWGADLMVSIHHNAGGGDGAEGYHSVFADKGNALVSNILNEFAAIGQNIRGNFTRWNSSHNNDYYGIIRGVSSSVSAVLVEFGFIDTADAQAFDTPAERSVEALAIAKGILKTIGIAFTAPVQPESVIKQAPRQEILKMLTPGKCKIRSKPSLSEPVKKEINGGWKLEVFADKVGDKKDFYQLTNGDEYIHKSAFGE